MDNNSFRTVSDMPTVSCFTNSQEIKSNTFFAQSIAVYLKVHVLRKWKKTRVRKQYIWNQVTSSENMSLHIFQHNSFWLQTWEKGKKKWGSDRPGLLPITSQKTSKAKRLWSSNINLILVHQMYHQPFINKVTVIL